MKKLAIVEDNAQYRKVLELILSETEQFNIIYLLESAEAVPDIFMSEQPDIVIMDIDLPSKNGIEAVKEIKTIYPGIKILMLTVFEDTDKIFNAIKAGANGYLLKKDSPGRIIEAIEQLERDESPINSVIASKLLEYFQKEKQPTDAENFNLTTREKEILHHLVNGHSYKEIASICNITFQTLNSHTKKIYQKLNIHSRAEAAARFGKLRIL